MCSPSRCRVRGDSSSHVGPPSHKRRIRLKSLTPIESPIHLVESTSNPSPICPSVTWTWPPPRGAGSPPTAATAHSPAATGNPPAGQRSWAAPPGAPGHVTRHVPAPATTALHARCARARARVSYAPAVTAATAALCHVLVGRGGGTPLKTLPLPPLPLSPPTTPSFRRARRGRHRCTPPPPLSLPRRRLLCVRVGKLVGALGGLFWGPHPHCMPCGRAWGPVPTAAAAAAVSCFPPVARFFSAATAASGQCERHPTRQGSVLSLPPPLLTPPALTNCSPPPSRLGKGSIIASPHSPIPLSPPLSPAVAAAPTSTPPL